MRKINYKSDFDFILRLTDADGEPIGFPSYDWTLNIYAKRYKATTYTASSIGGVLTNCVNDDGDIRIVCNDHNLGKGTLYGEFYADVPNVIYSDGYKLTVTPFALDIQLVDAAGDEPKDFEVENTVPMVIINAYELAVKQGYQGTQAEFYAALTTLPGLVGEVQSREDEWSGAETAREQAEQARRSAETSRADAEAARELAETTRQSAESARSEAETQRASAETARQSAEHSRAEAETQRGQAETKREAEFATLKNESQSATSAANAAVESAQQAIDDTQREAGRAISQALSDAQDGIGQAQQAIEDTRQSVEKAISEGAAAVIASAATLRLDRETGRLLLTFND